MSINSSLSILHLFIGLIQFTAALFAYLSNRKSRPNQIIAVLLVILGLTSLSVGFELNALTPGQALPWVAIELFSVYAAAAITFLVAVILFVPALGDKPIFRIFIASIVVVPLLLLIIDLLNQSVPLVGFHFIINISDFYSRYTPGYIEIMQAANGALHVGLFWLRNILYGVLIFYPLSYFIWQKRKTDRFNTTQAALLLGATLIAALFNTLLLRLLPETVPSLISNLGFTIALSAISFRNSEITAASGRSLDFFQNLRMFNKLLLNVIGIVLPAVLFLNFTIYSILLNNTLENSNTALRDFASSQAFATANEIEEILHGLEHVSEEYAIIGLVTESNQDYTNLSVDEITARLTSLEISGVYTNLGLEAENDFPSVGELTQKDTVMELSLVNLHGGLIANSTPPTEFNFSNSDWWLQISSQQDTYIGPPSWDQENGTYVINTAIPIFGTNNQFAGALKATYSLEGFLAYMNEQSSPDLRLGINVTNQELISSQNQERAAVQLPVWMSTPENDSLGWDVFELDQEYVLMSSVPIPIEESDTPADWQISAYQPLDKALSPLFSARNSLIISSLVILLLSGMASVFFARGISQPLVALTDAAQKILERKFDVEIDISGEDELGTLATTFKRMTNELSMLVNTLESTVDSRTHDLQRRTVQMQTSAQVARQASEIRDLQSLLNESVTLISSSFGFYHTGIFLLDSTGRYAVLQAASSPGGQRMLARGHRLQVGKVGVVGYCAGTGAPRISQDVGADIVYYDNPDMPQTRSELALPLRVREAIIGVLDVQSTEASAFSSEDIDVLQTLADQIALAIDNVRLLQSSQRALEELQRLYGQQAGQAWRQRISKNQIAYQFTPTGLELSDHTSPPSLQNRPGHRLKKEIRFRGQKIGNLNLIRETEDGNWSEEEQALVDEILEQTALALENARLVDQIKLRSDQIQLLQEVSAISSEMLDEQKLLPILTEKLQKSLVVDHCAVILLNRQNATLRNSTTVDNRSAPLGKSVPIEDESITQRLIRNREVDVLRNANNDPKAQTFIQNFAVFEAETLIFMPIVVRDQTVGYIYMEVTDPDRSIDSEEINLFNQLSTQISTALENIRLFEETANRAERERQVAEITAKIRSSNDPQEILEMAVTELKLALNPVQNQEQPEIKTSSPSLKDNGKDSL